MTAAISIRDRVTTDVEPSPLTLPDPSTPEQRDIFAASCHALRALDSLAVKAEGSMLGKLARMHRAALAIVAQEAMEGT